VIIHENIIQRSDEWFQIRLGKFTGTDFATVANGRKDTRKKLIYKKAAEIMTGKPCERDFNNFQMDRGRELEDEARMAFELETGLEVREVGFIELDQYTGVSPDGLIGEKSGIEIKCKDTHTHIECLTEGDNSYKWQIQGGLYVSGRKSWFFVSYNKDFSMNKRLYIKEHTPDEKSFEMLRDGLAEMTTELKKVLAGIQRAA